VFHTGPHLWLLDSDTGTRSELPARGVALADASDPCNIGRRAAFDAVGRHLVYLRGARSHEQVIWHDLASGRELIVQVPNSAGPIWRAEPSVTPGWVRVFSVPQDTDADGRRRIPRTRRISRGDEVVSLTLHVGDDPRPTVGDDPRPIVGPGGPRDDGFSPIGGGMFAAMSHRRPPLLATTGSAPAVPPGCDHHIGLPTDLDGVRLVPLECHEELRLWWPQSHHVLPLPAGRLVDAPTQLDADDHLWRAAQLELRPHETHIVRVDTDTAIALTGPRVLLDVVEPGQEPIRTDRAGWLYFNNPAGLLAFHITTGETRVHLGVIARELRPGAAQLLGRWYALDPARARMHALERAPHGRRRERLRRGRQRQARRPRPLDPPLPAALIKRPRQTPRRRATSPAATPPTPRASPRSPAAPAPARPSAAHTQPPSRAARSGPLARTPPPSGAERTRTAPARNLPS
jgi:hypothetical protein